LPASTQPADEPEDASLPSTATTVGSANDAAKDYAVWVAIESSGNAAAYQAYLEEFPSGRFAAKAKEKLAAAEAARAEQQAALEAEAAAQAAAAAEAAQQKQQEQAAVPSARQIQRMFPNSGKRRLSADELYGLSCDELWVARNEMFDRRGYCFSSGRGQSYFDNSDCTTSSSSILNKTEKANVTTIKQVEAEKGCN
jgi:hypothetical protein